MAITFPTSPVEGQTFTDNNVVYRYSAARGYWTTISLSSITLTQLQRESFVATEGQTVHTFNYDPGAEIQVVMNGIILRETDYTATNGTSITFTEAFVAGDQVDIFFYPVAAVVAPTSINDLTDVTVTNPTTNETLVYNGAQWVNQTAGGGSVSTYTTIASLPLSNNNQGDLVYVSENNRLYIWNGSGWYNIALINTAPSITSGGAGNYYLETDGTPTVITLNAEDPEEIPITWSYAITSGSLGSTATINQADNVFTITPSVNQADEGQFSITFTASDGVNIATEINSFTLVFSKAEGGTQTIIDVSGVSYILHEFTSNGVFNLNTDVEVEYVLVGGGGAGGSGEASVLGDGGGGGGAGGVLIGTQTLTAGSYSVTIGQGGQGSRYHIHPAGDGEDTSLVGPITLTAFGGGSGGHESGPGQNGGSSGGAGGICSFAHVAGSLEGDNQGNKGGERPGNTSCGDYRGGAGGGGAGSAGVAQFNTGGNGGAGIVTDITGINQYIAAGGGGGRGASNAQSINGGTGGGGSGGNGADTQTHGSTYGSAGGGGSSGGFDGGIGYQGVVWIRYAR